MFISITFRGASIDKTNKTQQNVREAQNLCPKCPPFTRTHAFERLHHCAIAVAVRWCGPAASTRSADVLSTPSHHGSANGRPSLEGYPRYRSPSDSNLANWMATSLEGQTLASLCAAW